MKTVVEKQQRISPWWVQLADGSYPFTVRSGWKPIEFDKGKSAIVVLSQDKLPAIIDTKSLADAFGLWAFEIGQRHRDSHGRMGIANG